MVGFAAPVFALLCIGCWLSPVYGLGATVVVAGGLSLCIVVLSAARGRRDVPVVEDFPAEEPVSKPSDIRRLVFLAILVRFAIATVVNFSPLWRAFAPDANAWEAWGVQLHLRFGDFLMGEHDFPVNPHVFVNAIFSSLLGSSRFAVSLFNAGFGILQAFLIRSLAKAIYGERVAHRAFIITLFFPSLILWQAQNLKDVWAQVSTAGLALSVVRFGQDASSTQRLGWLLFGLVFMAVATATRPYLAVILLASVVISFVFVRFRNLPSSIAIGVLALLGGKAAGLDELVSTETLVTLDQARKGLAYGGSAYGQNVDTTTVSGALSYFPEGFARFLFAPFPWEIDSWLQVLALPESIFFLILSVQAVIHYATNLSEARKTIVPVALFFCISASYALASGNEGTAFRHRAQVIAFIIILASARQLRVTAGDPSPAGQGALPPLSGRGGQLEPIRSKSVA